MKASEFLQTIRGKTASAARDAQVVAAARAGGLREWTWVDVPVSDPADQSNHGHFRVQADYVSIGESGDWVRVPMGGAAAQEIADLVGAILPSAFMVELIWRAASVKLTPITFPTAGMTSTERFVEHHNRIEKQREGREGLIAGIKKDTVVTNKLLKKPNATAIFGWHYPNGRIIQPVSTAHDQPWYSDYSQGVRLVAPDMLLRGETVRVQDVLRDPARAAVLTGGKAWVSKVDGAGDEVLQVVRYGQQQPERVQVQVPATVAPAQLEQPSVSPDDLGARALVFCQAELGANIRETPDGSNKHPRIAEYFKPARRRETGKLLGISSGDWCAVAQSAALAAAARPDEPVPHGYRAAVWELREDAKTTGAWVPAADVRGGKYRPEPGDLLTWTRGAPGLGHVSRVEVAPTSDGSVVTIGGNEFNTWTRRTRNLGEKEFEGVIRYRDFRPVMTLDAPPPTLTPSSMTAAPTSSNTPAKGKEDAWANAVFLRAWEKEFPGVKPTPAERQTILAIARHERFYGLSPKPAAGVGANNWGGVQCAKKGDCGPDCYPGGDKDRAGVGYSACFRRYATPEDGARHLIQLVTRRRPHVHAAMKRGDLTAVATEMGTERTINGKLYRIYHETNPPVYANALSRHAKELTAALHEPLAVGLQGASIRPESRSAPVPQPRVEQRSRVAIAAYGPQTRLQNGIRAIVKSRDAGLERVVIGAPLPAWQPNAFAKAMTRPSVGSELVVGVDTSTAVVDYATRVDDYIRSLHAIIEDERQRRAQPDGFPWNEWAAFRATWSETYFQITHSMVPNFDDALVRTYDSLSRKWADVVFAHYGRRPEGPVVDPPGSMVGKALAGFATLATIGVIVYAVSR